MRRSLIKWKLRQEATQKARSKLITIKKRADISRLKQAFDSLVNRVTIERRFYYLLARVANKFDTQMKDNTFGTVRRFVWSRNAANGIDKKEAMKRLSNCLG